MKQHLTIIAGMMLTAFIAGIVYTAATTGFVPEKRQQQQYDVTPVNTSGWDTCGSTITTNTVTPYYQWSYWQETNGTLVVTTTQIVEDGNVDHLGDHVILGHNSDGAIVVLQHFFVSP